MALDDVPPVVSTTLSVCLSVPSVGGGGGGVSGILDRCPASWALFLAVTVLAASRRPVEGVLLSLDSAPAARLPSATRPAGRCDRV